MKTVSHTESILCCGSYLLLRTAYCILWIDPLYQPPLFPTNLLNRQIRVNTVLTNIPLNPLSVAFFFLSVWFCFPNVFPEVSTDKT